MRNLADPVTLVRSPILTNGMSLVSVNGSRPGEAHQRREFGNRTGRDAPDGFGDRLDVFGRRAAAAADDVDQAVAREARDQAGHLVRRFVVAAEFVGQAGVGICRDERLRDASDFLEVFAHGRRAQRAIEADRERPRMAHRMPERGWRLPGKGAAGTIGDRARYHHGKPPAERVEHPIAGEDRRLGVERVENRLDQNDVGAAVDEAFDLLGIGVAQFVESDRAEAGIVHVGRKRGGAIGRAERARDEARLAVETFSLQRRATREARAVAVELIDHLLHAVIGLGDACGGKRIGLQDVRARHRISEQNILDCPRLRQGQQIVVALEMAFTVDETLAAEVTLVEREVLNLGSHRPVEDENALARRRPKSRRTVTFANEILCRSDFGVQDHVILACFSMPHNHIKISLCNCKSERSELSPSAANRGRMRRRTPARSQFN